MGVVQLAGGSGGANRRGGLCANGMPRYVLDSPGFDGSLGTGEACPTMMPDAIVTVGAAARSSNGAAYEDVRRGERKETMNKR